jgi:hypothetical protein
MGQALGTLEAVFNTVKTNVKITINPLLQSTWFKVGAPLFVFRIQEERFLDILAMMGMSSSIQGTLREVVTFVGTNRLACAACIALLICKVYPTVPQKDQPVYVRNWIRVGSLICIVCVWKHYRETCQPDVKNVGPQPVPKVEAINNASKSVVQSSVTVTNDTASRVDLEGFHWCSGLTTLAGGPSRLALEPGGHGNLYGGAWSFALGNGVKVCLKGTSHCTFGRHGSIVHVSTIA